MSYKFIWQKRPFAKMLICHRTSAVCGPKESSQGKARSSILKLGLPLAFPKPSTWLSLGISFPLLTFVKRGPLTARYIFYKMSYKFIWQKRPLAIMFIFSRTSAVCGAKFAHRARLDKCIYNEFTFVNEL